MKEKYIQIKPDEFSKLDFEVAIEIEKIVPLPEKCECIYCEAYEHHLDAAKETNMRS